MRAIALLAFALATAAAAQGPKPPAGARQVKMDVSPAGQAILKRYMGAPDAALVQRVGQLRAIRQQIAALTLAPKLDRVRLQALFRQQEATQVAIQRLGNDRTVAMLSALSDADRLKFVQTMRAAAAAQRPAPR